MGRVGEPREIARGRAVLGVGRLELRPWRGDVRRWRPGAGVSGDMT
jgi:hypothetical protein